MRSTKAQMSVDFLTGVVIFVFGFMYLMGFLQSTVVSFAVSDMDNSVDVNSVADEVYTKIDGEYQSGLSLDGINDSYDSFYNVSFKNQNRTLSTYGYDVPQNIDVSSTKRVLKNDTGYVIMEVRKW